MYRHWHYNALSGLLGASKLRGPYDGGGSGASTGGDGNDGGGGGDQASGDGDGDGGDPHPAGDDDGQVADGHADGTDDEDDLDDELRREEYRDLETDPRVKRLLDRNAKLSKRDKRYTPAVRALREFGVDIRQPGAIRALLMQQNRGDGRGDQRSATPPPEDPRDAPLPEDLEFKFDTSALAAAGWDLTDPLNRGLITMFEGQARQLHEMRIANHRLVNVMRTFSREVGQDRTTRQREAARAEGRTWQESVDGAARSIKDPAIAREFKWAVFGRKQAAAAAGQRVDPKRIVQDVLRTFVRTGQITAGQAATATATQQRIADRNRTLPAARSVSGGGNSGSPTRDRSKETLRSIHKQHIRGWVGVLGR